MSNTLPTQQAMKNKKVKRKLRRLTSIMPKLEWRPDLSQVHMFRMPLVGGNIFKHLQIHTPLASGKKKVWANIYQQLSQLPPEIYMKDIEFGFIPYHQRDKNRIVWVDQQINIPVNDLKGLAFRGTAITYTEWEKTYNPYAKYNKFLIDVVRNNRRLQMSFPNLIKNYKSNGQWEKIKDIKGSIWDITTSNSLTDLIYLLNRNDDYPYFENIIVPNPIPSCRILIERIEKIPQFNFLLHQGTTIRHQLEKHISLPPKYNQTKADAYSKEEFDEAYEKYMSEGRAILAENRTRSDGTVQEEGDPF